MVEKYFNLSKLGTTTRTEVIAGFTTFMTMSYILAVNPIILGKTGMPAEGIFFATALASAVACLIMGLYAKLPIALAPGMGLNAFFAFTVVLGMGYSWQTALTAVFIEGIIFIILSLLKIRDAIIRSLPMCLKYGVASGIGLFITYIGLQDGGIVGDNPATLTGVSLKDNGALLTVIGFVITGGLVVRKVQGAFLIGIIVTTLIGFPLGVTHFDFSTLDYSKSFGTFLQLNFDVPNWGDMALVVISFLFVDLFDTSGTISAVALRAGLVDNVGNINNSGKALLSDSIGTVVGALFGTSTVTSYIESMSGIEAGGRSGLTAVVVGLLFLVSIIISPIFLMIPAQATAPVLIILGMYMLSPLFDINRDDYSEYLTLFVTLVVTPFSYSIATGLMFGLLTYVILKTIKGASHEVPKFTYFMGFLFLLKAINDYAIR